jgi:hypothetical protein
MSGCCSVYCRRSAIQVLLGGGDAVFQFRIGDRDVSPGLPGLAGSPEIWRRIALRACSASASSRRAWLSWSVAWISWPLKSPPPSRGSRPMFLILNSFSEFSAAVSFSSYDLIWSSMNCTAFSESCFLPLKLPSTKMVSRDCTISLPSFGLPRYR